MTPSSAIAKAQDHATLTGVPAAIFIFGGEKLWMDARHMTTLLNGGQIIPPAKPTTKPN